MSEKVMVFIDGQNFMYGSGKASVDYKKLIDHLTETFGEIRRTYYFTGFDPANAGQHRFFKYLKRCGVEVKVKPLVAKKISCPHCKMHVTRDVEKGVDVSLVTTLLDMGVKGGYDTAILISGDKDFIPAIESVKLLGKRLVVASFRVSAGEDVQLAGDKFYPLDDVLDKIKRETQED
jgi:uncharacterized LabA/DUF88 family protein